MSRGLLLWVLFGMLAGLAYNASDNERGARERMERGTRPGVRLMDGGDTYPPPPTTT
jgi:hypothetical protein